MFVRFALCHGAALQQMGQRHGATQQPATHQPGQRPGAELGDAQADTGGEAHAAYTRIARREQLQIGDIAVGHPARTQRRGKVMAGEVLESR